MDRSLLIIDDDAGVLSLLRRYLPGRGWLVLEAAEGSAGALLFERERPDLVLLDLQLPGLSGLRLLEILRARDPDAVVILLTGHGDIAPAVEGLRLGAESFLAKPVEAGHLEAVVERAYEKVELRRRIRYLTERLAAGAGPQLLSSPAPQADLTLEEVEKRHIAAVLRRQPGGIAGAARTLGISRSTLYEKMRKYDIGPVRVTRAVG